MKVFGIITFISLCWIGSSYGQGNYQKVMEYKSWGNSHEVIPIYKNSTPDHSNSSLVVPVSFLISYQSPNNPGFKEFQIIRIKENNGMGTNALIGALTGASAGTVLGLLEVSDQLGLNGLSDLQKVLVAGSSLAALGAGIGALLALFGINIPIGN